MVLEESVDDGLAPALWACGETYILASAQFRILTDLGYHVEHTLP